MKFKFIVLLLICIVLIHCGGGEKKIIPVVNTVPDTEPGFKSLIEHGDREFDKMYYMGWRNAVNFYKKALEIDKDNTDIKEKLFFAYFLEALREPLYFIDNNESLRQTHYWEDELNRSIPTKNTFSDIVGYLVGEKDPTSPEIAEASIQEIKKAADTDYKYFLYLKYAGLRLDILARQKEADIFLGLYPSSNLRYFAQGTFDDLDITIEKYPDFFELLLVRGDMAFQTKDIEKARQDYLKTVGIYPGIPPAWYGLGNVYYEIGLVQKALEYYDEALKISPTHFGALYKKGVCLHDLQEYNESNNIMDIVGKDALFEKGDAFYYKALNYFNLKNYRQVEVNIKIAESLIPDSFQLNILAGVFYYQTDRFPVSRLYFEKAKEISSDYPESYYYQGLMDLKDKKMKRAMENFYLAGTYYKLLLEKEFQAIKYIDEKNYTPGLKLQVKRVQEKRLQEDAALSIQKLTVVLDALKNSHEKEIIDLRRTVQNIKEKYLLNRENNRQP
jgi:tetratricopeptide (TPR) repeat protein